MTRIAITIAHESGHAAASLLSGRRLEGIRLHADTSGETVSRGRRNGPGIVITALAGYVTPPLLGVGACALLAAHRVTLLLSLLLLLLAVTLVMVRNWYGVLSVLVTAGALVAVSWLADPALRAAFAYAVAWFLLFGGVRPVVELARTRTRAVRLPPGRRLATGPARPRDVRRRPARLADPGTRRGLGVVVRAGRDRRGGARRPAAQSRGPRIFPSTAVAETEEKL